MSKSPRVLSFQFPNKGTWKSPYKKKKKQTTTKIKTKKKTNHQLYDVNALSLRVIALIGNCPLQKQV